MVELPGREQGCKGGSAVAPAGCPSLRAGTGMPPSSDTRGQENACSQMYNDRFKVRFC